MEHRAKIAAAGKGRRNSPETLAKMSLSAKRLLMHPDRRMHLRKMTIAARHVKPSSLELAVRALLDRLQIVYQAEHPIGPYIVDIFIPNKRLVIECDGAYWHSRWEARERDARRDAYMRARRYSVLRLPEDEIRHGRIEARLRTWCRA